jgi:hypothetical protein
MGSEQLWDLMGAVVGSALGAGLVVWGIRRFKPELSKRVPIVAVAVSAGVVSALAGMRTPRATWSEFAKGFDKGCRAECEKAQGHPALCPSYCTCELEALRAGHSQAELERWLEQHLPGGKPDAAAQERFRQLIPQCYADLYDARFMDHCAAECKDEAKCVSTCKCVLTKLREGFDRVSGTRWLMSKLEVQPPAQEAQVKLDAVTAICQHQAGL